MPKALIIGSGVAGPATALLLRRAGWDVEIFEADPAPDPYAGLFLNVATNGLGVLSLLGLRERLLADAHPAARMVLWSSSGKVLGTMPNGPVGEPERGGVIVRRAWLHTVLRDAVAEAGIPLTPGARLTDIDETPTAVRATFADGSTAEGDILVGCDGIRSRTRTWIDPQAPAPTYTGLVGLGGFVTVEGLAPTVGEQHFLFGRRSFFGHLVRHDGTVYWFANVTVRGSEADVRRIGSQGWLARLRDLHGDDPAPVPQILDAVHGELRAYPIHDLVGVRRWSRGRVVALGDAVHATSPSVGQGVALALEDAVALAASLRDAADHTAAFAAYQGMRQERVGRVVGYARAVNAQKRVTKSRVGVAIRDAMMPLFLRRAGQDARNDWLYNETVGGEVVAGPAPSSRP